MKIYIKHPGADRLQPSSVRVAAYKFFFESSGIAECVWDIDKKKSYLKIWIDCILGRYDAVLLSMPPFRGWWLFFLPFTKVILDIRDGWSIAIDSGYGGNASKNHFKAKIARMVERWAIRRSFISITCTTGLQAYLQSVAGHGLIFIPNGIGDDDLQIIKTIKNNIAIKKKMDEIVFCCAGQFSEYGQEKVKILLQTVAQRYAAQGFLVIRLIGCNHQKNLWLIDYFKQLTNERGRVEILEKMEKRRLFEIMVTSDYGLSVLRDPEYEFGTKVFDYIALGLPVVNYFDSPNKFTDYFDGCLDVPFNKKTRIPEIRRSVLIANALENVNW